MNRDTPEMEGKDWLIIVLIGIIFTMGIVCSERSGRDDSESDPPMQERI